MGLAFDPSLLPDPLTLERLRDVSHHGRQARPVETADWYTPTLQFGKIGPIPKYVAPTSNDDVRNLSPTISFFGRFEDSFTVDIPPRAIQAIFDLEYGNFDAATFSIAQGSSTVYGARIDWPRGFTNVRYQLLYDLSAASPLRKLTYWTLSQFAFGGFWAGTLNWRYDTPDGTAPIYPDLNAPPPPPPAPVFLGTLPIVWDCMPFGWSLSSYTPGDLVLRLMYADYAVNPSFSLLSVANAPTLTSSRRNRFEQMPWLLGWRPVLLRGGSIQVWADAATDVDQCQLVLYCRKLKGR